MDDDFDLAGTNLFLQNADDLDRKIAEALFSNASQSISDPSCAENKQAAQQADPSQTPEAPQSDTVSNDNAETDLCCICLDCEPDATHVLPCGHKNMCAECATTLVSKCPYSRCPYCRMPYRKRTDAELRKFDLEAAKREKMESQRQASTAPSAQMELMTSGGEREDGGRKLVAEMEACRASLKMGYQDVEQQVGSSPVDQSSPVLAVPKSHLQSLAEHYKAGPSYASTERAMMTITALGILRASDLDLYRDLRQTFMRYREIQTQVIATPTSTTSSARAAVTVGVGSSSSSSSSAPWRGPAPGVVTDAGLFAPMDEDGSAAVPRPSMSRGGQQNVNVAGTIVPEEILGLAEGTRLGTFLQGLFGRRCGSRRGEHLAGHPLYSRPAAGNTPLLGAAAGEQVGPQGHPTTTTPSEQQLRNVLEDDDVVAGGAQQFHDAAEDHPRRDPPVHDGLEDRAEDDPRSRTSSRLTEYEDTLDEMNLREELDRLVDEMHSSADVLLDPTRVICPCGQTMQRVSARSAYASSLGCPVECDLCNRAVRGRIVLYHCPAERTGAHPFGFDLCYRCATGNDENTICPPVPQLQQAAVEGLRVLSGAAASAGASAGAAGPLNPDYSGIGGSATGSPTRVGCFPRRAAAEAQLVAPRAQGLQPQPTTTMGLLL
eukprot:g4647.t1